MLGISVNKYVAMTNSNYISVKPGTQVINIPISVTNNFKAIKLYLVPLNSDSNLATLSFSSNKNFTMTKDLRSIDFSISTSSDSKNSINYIT